MSLTIALSKGRLADKTVEILEKCGVSCAVLKKDTRKLILENKDGIKFVFVKPVDVPTYVERGAADIGVVGKDTLLEENKDVYEPIDLNIAKCRMCVAGKKGANYRNLSRNLIVATKYPVIAKNFYDKMGQAVDIVKLNGSIELAPLIGLSDVIVDLVESGKTLQANDLQVLGVICDISARLIVNKVSLKTKRDVILPLLEKIKKKVINDR